MQKRDQSSSASAASDTAASENKVWYLKRSRLFERATDETIANCEHLFVQQNCARGHVLFEQGDDARAVFLVKRGTVRIARRTVDGRDITVAILGAGSIFGEEVVFSDVERKTVAICMSDSLLCMARAEAVYGLMTRFSQVAVNVAKYVHERRDEALAIAEDVAYLTVPERLMRLFERLSKEHGSSVVDGTLIDLRLTHTDLASLIGSTRETVSTKLAQLVRAGEIRVHEKTFVVLHTVGTA